MRPAVHRRGLARLRHDGRWGAVGTPAADAVLAAFHLADGSALRVGSRGRLVHGDGSPSGLTFEVVVDDATDLPCMAVTDGGETARASILGLTMRGWRFAGLGDGEARP